MNPITPLPQNAEAGGAPAAAPANRVHLAGLTHEEARAWLAALGEQRYRADQLLDWVYQRGATSFDEMTSLSKLLRAKLAADGAIYRATVTRESIATDGTRKLLLTWPDGEAVETVWIPDAPRHTVCVSSQVGCPVGCRFCASGVDGVRRNLTAGEIVEQALRVAGLVRATGDAPRFVSPTAERDAEPNAPATAETAAGPAARLSNVVFMGMGEPLANYEHVLRAIRILNAPWGLGIGARKITVSTVGLPKQIRRLAQEDLQLNLALSLHAPDDELRQRLIPWGKVPIDELLNACQDYFRQTGREITLEYVLLEGVNMRPEHALRLAGIAARLRANVNLLRYNPVPGLPYVRPSAEAAYDFQQRLRVRGCNAHIRTSRGQDIAAACGQLRRAAAARPG